jgi:hypothetical protein
MQSWLVSMRAELTNTTKLNTASWSRQSGLAPDNGRSLRVTAWRLPQTGRQGANGMFLEYWITHSTPSSSVQRGNNFAFLDFRTVDLHHKTSSASGGRQIRVYFSEDEEYQEEAGQKSRYHRVSKYLSLLVKAKSSHHSRRVARMVGLKRPLSPTFQKMTTCTAITFDDSTRNRQHFVFISWQIT